MSDATVVTRAPADASPARFLALKRLALALAGLAAAAGLAAYGYRVWEAGRFIETTDDAYIGANVTSIAPQVGGFITSIDAEDNQRVSAGQLLVTLDARDYQALRDHAAAEVDARTAALNGLRARSKLQEAVIRQQQADLVAKTARAGFTAADAERFRSLAQSSTGTRQDADRSLMLDREAHAAVASSTAGLEAAQEQAKVLEADTARAEAELAQAGSDLRAANLNLSYTEVRSPIDGFVGNRAAQLGSHVAPGAYLLSVIPPTGLWVDANFKESQLARIVPGQAVDITLDILPGHAFHGHVFSLAPGTGAIFSVIPPENATGNFTKVVQRVPVRVAFDEGDPLLPMLRPGLSATVGIDTQPAADKP
jgi:membrane fusion protein, multidrug efflux system